MDDDSKRGAKLESRELTMKHLRGKDGTLEEGRPNEKKRKEKRKKAGYNVFYIYHMIARTPGTKVQINLNRSTWCDVERITVRGIVALAFDGLPTMTTMIWLMVARNAATNRLSFQ